MAESALRLPVGRRTSVRVPANSANLGPGFDALGLALAWYDECEIEVLAEGVLVEVTGEGADTVPADRSHLVLACLDQGLATLGAYAAGVRLRAHNTIPHTRGLGSSAAAAVAGLLAAWALARPGVDVDRAWLLDQAYLVEGHADNVAAAIHGGFVLTWVEETSGRAYAVSAPVHLDVRVLAYVHADPVATASARRVLPAQVPHAEAASNAARAALLAHAFAHAPELLLPATREWLHQDYRAELMPASLDLVNSLRGKGFGAVISGAGPTVLIFTDAASAEKLDGSEAPGFIRHELAIGAAAEVIG